jgi:hypothetical protein
VSSEVRPLLARSLLRLQPRLAPSARPKSSGRQATLYKNLYKGSLPVTTAARESLGFVDCVPRPVFRRSSPLSACAPKPSCNAPDSRSCGRTRRKLYQPLATAPPAGANPGEIWKASPSSGRYSSPLVIDEEVAAGVRFGPRHDGFPLIRSLCQLMTGVGDAVYAGSMSMCSALSTRHIVAVRTACRPPPSRETLTPIGTPKGLPLGLGTYSQGTIYEY